MATPQRAENGDQGREQVSIGQLLAFGAAVQAVSTPPRRVESQDGAERAAESGAVVETVLRQGGVGRKAA
ncbi:hypothetical protein AB0G79_05175 [Streptomyces sp. NPDC020807]|uniref:hypothetical protein n=1 Tax=Streptomyces sp. NPDC020807 TaxID=3155119 RepID=UPI0033D618CF